MKDFNDLVFETHPIGEGVMCQMFFENGYGVSVIGGGLFYGNGEATFEVAIMEMVDGESCLTYNTAITNDVLGGQTKEQVSDIMRRVQELQK